MSALTGRAIDHETAARTPIPRFTTPLEPTWVDVDECGEALVTVPEGDGLHVAPAYHERGIAAADDHIRVRRRVLDALRRASAALPDGLDLLLWDGLRSLDTQLEIVQSFRETLPGPDRDEVVEQYLALPPESEESFRALPPPHSTGGAIDLTLCDTSGRPLDLGAEFDQFDEAAWLTYFEDAAGPRTRRYRDLRRILFWTMLGAGFSPYTWEYWHYELHTMVAAAYYRRPTAEYGPATPWREPPPRG